MGSVCPKQATHSLVLLPADPAVTGPAPQSRPRSLQRGQRGKAAYHCRIWPVQAKSRSELSPKLTSLTFLKTHGDCCVVVFSHTSSFLGHDEVIRDLRYPWSFPCPLSELGLSETRGQQLTSSWPLEVGVRDKPGSGGGWPQNQLLLRHMWDGVHLQGAKQPLEAGEASFWGAEE